ncbi:MAG: hypothetical protein AAF216_06735 [Pseudomonadota bacterium]
MRSAAICFVGLVFVAGCEHVRSSDRESAFQHCRWIEDDGERLECIDEHVSDAELDRNNRAKAIELEVAAAEQRQSVCMAHGGSEDSCAQAADRGIRPDRPVDPENTLGKIVYGSETWTDPSTWEPD